MATTTRAEDLLAGYPVIEGVYDEGFAADATPRPWARAALEAVCRADPASLSDRISRSLKRSGVRFSSVEGDLEFYVDPVPRVITAAEWEPVKRGLAQRVRALNAFVADVYGAQTIVAEGLVPPDGDPHRRLLRARDARRQAAERRLDRRRRPGHRPRRHRRVARARGQRPHARAASRTCTRPGAPCSSTSTSRRARPRARWTARSTCSPTPCAPPRPRASAAGRAPLAAVLTDGEHNSAYWEHAWLSRQLGIPLVEPRELELRDGVPVAAGARPARAPPHRRHLPPHQRRPPGLRPRPAPDRAGPPRRARPRQPVRHRRRRRQAHPRLRRDHDPLLPRRGARAALGPDLRPRPARRSSRRRSTSSTSSS